MSTIKISTQEIEYFQKTGAICLRNVFSTEWIDKIASGIEKNLKNPSKYSEKLTNAQTTPPEESNLDKVESYYFNDYCNWKSIPEFHDYIYNSPAALIVGQLFNTNYVSFYHEHVLIKEIGSTRPTPWHVDQSYYPIDGKKVCSIWMPIDKIELENTIQFIEGSHLWEEWLIPRKFATSLNYPRKIKEGDDRSYINVPTDEELVKNYNVVEWSVEPGDCVVFHMKTLHGAPGNKSKVNRRRIFSTRWLGDDAVIAQRPWEISPPTYGGLNIGDKAISEEFPVVWTK